MSRLPTLFVSHGSPMNAAVRTRIERCVGGTRARRGLGRGRCSLSSAHWETAVPMLTGSAEARNDSRFRRIPRGALPDPISGARCAGPRCRGGDSAEGRRHHRGHQRLPRTRSRRVGAAALDVPGGGRAGRPALAPARARPGAARRARPRARALGGRRRADRRIGARDPQSRRLDGESAAAGTAALRAGVCDMALRATRRARHGGARRLSGAGAGRRARASVGRALPAAAGGVGRGRRRCRRRTIVRRVRGRARSRTISYVFRPLRRELP